MCPEVNQGLSSIYMGKPVGPQFVQMVNSTPEWNGFRRLMCTICAICSNLPRESGISLTNGAGPGTGRKRHTGTASFRSDTPVGVPLETFRLYGIFFVKYLTLKP